MRRCRSAGRCCSRRRSGFLGAGIPEPTPSIGGLLGGAGLYYRTDPGLILYPAIFLGLLVLAVNLVGESLRSAEDGR